ncbi:hypothetical protein [Anaeromicropila herbilytica]|uniref:Uncharacterized protein n=1 Tax=Anaeromicropila herbilytica TaxID=2785025 RepID=A0A7R7EIN0_9FIRM|nr:hypothetical protein [Anaeromicropila herbilytica]BCN29875.1 hypothetical protein bsdtb5_11700 [Anaeromicropila herbilytica]
MPQMNKGGKYIFGKSIIKQDNSIQFPTQAIVEYDIKSEGYIYLMTGSKATGGFCVMRKGLLYPSKLGHILTDNKGLCDYSIPMGEFIPYKGRSYCWITIDDSGRIQLTDEMMHILNLENGMELLSIRSSDIAFTMGAEGPLLEKAKQFSGEIEVY